MIRRFDGELVLFDLLSWRTHLLNATAAQLIDLLEQHSLSTHELSQRLAPDDPDFEKQVDLLLKGLSDLGLVEAIDQ
jgi:PqqD family protein of HPr-rel-A system